MIAKEKFGSDYNAVNDITRLSIGEIRTCVMFKALPDDDPLPTTKKELLVRWNETKDRSSLTEVEYLTLFANTSGDVIAEVVEELFCGELPEAEADNINENADVDSCIGFGMTSV